MVTVLKFQAVGSLVTIHLNLQKMMKSPESRCRRQHKGKNEKKSQFPNMNKTLFKKFFMQEKETFLTTIDSMPKQISSSKGSDFNNLGTI